MCHPEARTALMTHKTRRRAHADGRAASEGDAKIRLYGASDFGAGLLQTNRQSVTGRLILDEEHTILPSPHPTGNGAFVVDVGTGNGRLLPLLRQLGYEPLGVDLSLSMMVADAALSEQRLRGDAHRLPFADGSVARCAGQRCGTVTRTISYYWPSLHGSRPSGWICADILRWTPSVLARKVGATLPAGGASD